MSTVQAAEKLAIDGGVPVRDTSVKPWPKWPLNSEEEWRERIEPALRQVYLDMVEGTPGPRGLEFGDAFARYCDAEYGIIMPHGTDAISAAIAGALDLDGVGEAGEIIIPNYTFIATASAPLSIKCKLALVDIHPESFTLCPEAVEAAVNENTVGILPVHVGGHPADMDALNAIAEKRGLVVVEDCAQAHGAEVHGKKVGALGHAGAFSFQSSKNLTCGEGGCVTTNDKDIRDRAFAFKDVGRRFGGERWEYPRLGWNYRTSEYLAAILLARLGKLEDQTDLRNENALYLNEGLESIGGIKPPKRMPWLTQHGYHLYMMLYEPEAFGGKSRDEFVRALSGEGISCTPGYRRPLTDEGGLKTMLDRYPDKVRRLPCPNVEYTCEHSVWFYQSQLLGTREDMDDILEAVSKIKAAFTS